MSTWAERAKTHFSQKRQNGTAETAKRVCDFSQERQNSTAETAERGVLAVLAVPFWHKREKHDFSNQAETAANDPTLTTTATADLSTTVDTIGKPLPSADTTLADIGTVRPAGLTPALMAASRALDARIHAAGALPGNDADRWCYPSTTAMNGAEIDTFTARLGRFTDKGATQVEAETLADKLVQRDRDTDTRTLCLECQHLQGYGAASWRCGNWQAAGIGINPRSTQLPAGLVFQLQRCNGYTTQGGQHHV